ncbi:MAG: hypothetical protein ATN34_03315 [Epulopiscium sp. Nele67-Bin002]|nr:MAG: hypothetical protein BEN18_11075 [Epulopiscium sp. Nuni2H_MBin001]OON91756.1 MAG: hypothetical protein ATN34_03315 [Epulopiscium sp. Nele67-Bin002]OON93205.1 MAG: hypothetical protein ATN33_00555 [Epulopiscium sp. Nele67-Bin001]
MRYLRAVAITFFLMAFYMPIFANTIITVPLDSRPISLEYLENLVTLGGDNFVCVEHLDKYNSYEEPNYQPGDSEKIRQQLSELVNENNNKNTSVIINLTSAVYGGLIESRQCKDQATIDSAVENLEALMTYAPNPTYYLHMSMPRTLPDARAGDIWPDAQSLNGLGYYYLQEFPNTEGIRSAVPADEFLLEWGYVENKRLEMGDESLFSWENKFLQNFNTKYLASAAYKPYILNYQNLYAQASQLVKQMIDLVSTLRADELIISVDDYQLPVFVQALIQNNLAQPPVDEQGNIIKFSWARKYLESDQDSVYRYHASRLGEQSVQDAVEGMGDKVNYIFGTDEVPQMIYARDLAKRNEVTTSFLPVTTNHLGNSNINNTGYYDVLSTEELYIQRLNFVSCKNYDGSNHYNIVENIYSKPFQFYINKYMSSQSEANGLNDMISDMFSSYNRGNNIGVIELYNDNVIMREDRILVNKLLSKSQLDTIGLSDNNISQLATYSSWNTEGNAIGLGVAHAQVFGIVDMLELEYDEAVKRGKAQYEILLQHLIEDNLYTASVKSNIHIKDYEIFPKDMVNTKLLMQMPVLELLEQFMNHNSTISLAGHQLSYNDITIEALSFPWLRTFDLFVDINIY